MEYRGYISLALIASIGSFAGAYARIETFFSTPEEAIRAIVSNHTRVFSKENILLSPISSEDHQAWFTLLQNLKDYVRNRQPDVVRYASNTLFQIAEQMEDSINSIFREDIVPAFVREKNKTEGVSASSITQKIDYAKVAINRNRINVPAITEKLMRLKNFKRNLDEIQKSFKKPEEKKSLVQKAKGYLSGPKTVAEACAKDPGLCRVLDTLASVLDATIDKADKDFEKLKVGFGLV